MGKKEMRERMAALSFSEKVKILEKLRDRSLALAASGLRGGRNLANSSHLGGARSTNPKPSGSKSN